MSVQLAHAVTKLVLALQQHFPTADDPRPHPPYARGRILQQTFARLLVDLPEEESSDQVLLTGRLLTPGAREISGVVGPLREVDRLLKESEPSPRRQYLAMLFKDLLESRAYNYYVLTAAGNLREPLPPIRAGEKVYAELYAPPLVLLDELRLLARETLAPSPPAPGSGSGRTPEFDDVVRYAHGLLSASPKMPWDEVRDACSERFGSQNIPCGGGKGFAAHIRKRLKKLGLDLPKKQLRHDNGAE